jgi:hypothetical protein
MKYDDPLYQTVAATTIGGAILEWWALALAIPGAAYYCILIAEKMLGKPIKEWFKKNETR